MTQTQVAALQAKLAGIYCTIAGLESGRILETKTPEEDSKIGDAIAKLNKLADDLSDQIMTAGELKDKDLRYAYELMCDLISKNRPIERTFYASQAYDILMRIEQCAKALCYAKLDVRKETVGNLTHCVISPDEPIDDRTTIQDIVENTVWPYIANYINFC